MPIKPDLENYDNSRWYKIMENKGEQWNQFASRFGFEVHGAYQHYYCRINGRIDLGDLVFEIKGQRQFVNELRGREMDTFYESLTLTTELPAPLKKHEFLFGSIDFVKRLVFWVKGVNVNAHRDVPLASKQPTIAYQIMDSLAWGLRKIKKGQLKDNRLELEFDQLLDNPKELDSLYASLREIQKTLNKAAAPLSNR